MERGDWIVPAFNGVLPTDKPPLHYFFMIAAYKMFGVNTFAARFFSAVMGLLTVLITYAYTKKITNAFTAFCTAIVLVASTHFLFEFRLSVPDPYLIFFITLGLFSAFTWLQENKTAELFIAASAFGLATLAKGPVALALPGICLLIWIIWKQKWKTVFTWKLIAAIILLCTIVLPWYIAVDKATNGEWTRGFFIDNNLNLFSDPQERHGGFFLVTLLFVVIGLLPFMVFAGKVFKTHKTIFKTDIVKFSGIVILAFVVFFSIASTRLPNYPMPCYPFAVIVLGSFIAALLNNEITSKKYPYYILLIFTTAVPVAGYFAITNETEAKELNWLPFILLVVPLILALSLFIKKNAPWQKKISVIFFAYLLFNVTGLGYIYPALYNQNPVAKTMDIIQKYPEKFCYNIFNAGFRFYVDKNIPVINSADTLRHWLGAKPGAIVITRVDFIDSLKSLQLTEIARHHDLFELPTTVILKKNAAT